LSLGVPEGTEPKPQGFARVLEKRAGGHASLASTRPTFIPTTSNLPRPGALAAGTQETSRPTQLDQIIHAVGFTPEPLFELPLIFWIIFSHGKKHYLLGLVVSSKYLGKDNPPYHEADLKGSRARYP